jgi:uncharacterized protein YdhG (YjbR/CyaY superfamily)
MAKETAVADGKLGPDEVDKYLATQLPEHRAELERIIGIVASVLPEAKPVISYQIIGFALGKKKFFYISGWQNHLSFHGNYSDNGVSFAEKYPEWFKLKGMTLQFQAKPQLPEAIIKELLAFRLERI